jgi:L-alanine-DL-glutamate epimerase-like enolase superfamily enzyme
MTLSLVAVITDVIRDGKPVVGYGFNSNGRYGQGKLMRERFMPRILEADPDSLLDDRGDNLDPHKIWDTMFTNEKPGGHGERSVAIGTIDMAVWDAVAKIEKASRCSSCWPTATATAAVNRKVFVYAAGGYYYPGQDHGKLKDEMRSYIDRGYTVVKMKIGGASLDEDLRRIDSCCPCCRTASACAWTPTAASTSTPPSQYAKALSQYDLFWYEEAGRPARLRAAGHAAQLLQEPDGDRREPVLDAGCAQPDPLRRHAPDRDWLQFDCALSYGLVEYLRTLDMLKQHGWSPSRCIPHGGHQMSLNIAAGLGLGGNESYPDLFQPFGGFPDGVKVDNGFVTMPDLPGIGFEGKATCAESMRSSAPVRPARRCAAVARN